MQAANIPVSYLKQAPCGLCGDFKSCQFTAIVRQTSEQILSFQSHKTQTLKSVSRRVHLTATISLRFGISYCALSTQLFSTGSSTSGLHLFQHVDFYRMNHHQIFVGDVVFGMNTNNCFTSLLCPIVYLSHLKRNLQPWNTHSFKIYIRYGGEEKIRQSCLSLCISDRRFMITQTREVLISNVVSRSISSTKERSCPFKYLTADVPRRRRMRNVYYTKITKRS